MYMPYDGRRNENVWEFFTTTQTHEISPSELTKICDRLLYFAELLENFDENSNENNMTKTEIVKMFNKYLSELSPHHDGIQIAFDDCENTYISMTTEEEYL